jgi:outer membrane protein TolC
LAEASATQKQKALSTASAFSFARQKLEVARKIFEATKLQAEVSRQRYTLGMMSFQDWDSYESDLMRSEGEVLRAKYNLSDAHADYLEAIGIALEEGP